MPNQPLPQQVTVRKLVESGAQVNGLVSDLRLPRVAQAVQQISTNIEADLHFGVDDSNKMIIGVNIQGAVDLPCQRCLEPVTIPLNIATTLTVVAHDEEARSCIRSLEPIVLEEGLLNIDHMLEEEILLSLPAVALHPKVAQDKFTASTALLVDETASLEHEEIERRSTKGLENPFAVLKTLTTEDGQE